MKPYILSGLAVLMAGSVIAADLSPKETVTGAVKTLGDKTNYSWKTTVTVPDDAPFKPGPTEGKTEKTGYTTVGASFFDNQIQAVLKGDKSAVRTEDGTWKTAEELEKVEGPGRFMAIMLRGIKLPANEASEIVSFAKELKKDGEAYAGELTEQGAKALQTFKLPGGENNVVKEAKGSARFWTKDGVLTKYEFKLKGLLQFGDNDFPNDRTTTVEIKDVGTTKVEAPDDAKKKLQ